MTLTPLMLAPFVATPLTFTPFATLTPFTRPPAIVAVCDGDRGGSIHDRRRRCVDRFSRRIYAHRDADSNADVDVSRRGRRRCQCSKTEYYAENLLIHFRYSLARVACRVGEHGSKCRRRVRTQVQRLCEIGNTTLRAHRDCRPASQKACCNVTSRRHNFHLPMCHDGNSREGARRSHGQSGKGGKK